MAVLEWDKVGERIYQNGVDRGVLYLNNGTVVPWNGLTSVEDGSNAELKSYYLDGLKILDHVIPGDFVGKLSAFTYPEEFDDVLGVVHEGIGLSFYEQQSKSFNLSYRTKISNDLDEDYGYKIHLLYNLRAIPDSQKFESIKDQGSATEFSWSLTASPPISTIYGVRPTPHISIDSRNSSPEILQELEDILYGTDVVAPRLPSITEVAAMYGVFGAFVIVDNGDGTWTAVDVENDYITMLDSTHFRIDNADVTYLDADTYEISSTNI